MENIRAQRSEQGPGAKLIADSFILGHEATILSRLMNYDDVSVSLSHINEGYFSNPNQLIFRAIVAVIDSGKRPVPAAVDDALRRAGHFAAVGGNGVVTSISLLPASDAITDYAAEELSDRYQRNRTAQVAEKMLRGEMAPDEALLALAEISDVRTSALDSLMGATLTESELDSRLITKRKPLLSDWFFEADLGFIFAKRGAGKTWLALHMARALAEGSACGPWKAHEAVKVLYIDGEMPLDEMRERNQALRDVVGDNLLFLSHQVVFDNAERNLCLSEPVFQSAVTKLCEEQGCKVVFIDNQSTLITRVRENSADDWRDIIEGWLLELRRRRIAVVIINHAGRNGEMRGTSKREDSAFWQIVLDPAEKQGEGARFLSQFTKNRNASQDPVSLNWHFRPEGERVIPTWSEADPLQVFRGWVENGLISCADIATEMGMSRGYVSKLAKRAEKSGWLKIEHREYRLMNRGTE